MTSLFHTYVLTFRQQISEPDLFRISMKNSRLQSEGLSFFKTGKISCLRMRGVYYTKQFNRKSVKYSTFVSNKIKSEIYFVGGGECNGVNKHKVFKKFTFSSEPRYCCSLGVVVVQKCDIRYYLTLSQTTNFRKCLQMNISNLLKVAESSRNK